MTGRNFGWAPDQYQQALAQVALVIRGDDGSDQLAQDRTNGLSMARFFSAPTRGLLRTCQSLPPTASM